MRDEPVGVDAVAQPRLLFLGSEGLAAADGLLKPLERLDVAPGVDREPPDADAVALERPFRQLVRPGEVVLRAGDEELDLVAESGRLHGEAVEQRLGAADGAGLVQPRTDER